MMILRDLQAAIGGTSTSVVKTKMKNVSINSFILDGVGAELGVFFVVTVIVMFLYLNKV